MKQLTWEEAKQKVAEQHGCIDFEQYVRLGNSVIKCCTEAADLMNQSNLERIKELEDGLKESKTIQFAVYLTGHDEATVLQMFNDWNK